MLGNAATPVIRVTDAAPDRSDPGPVTWATRTLLALLLALGTGCTSAPGAGPASEPEPVAPDWRGDAAQAASQMASTTARAAGATWQAARTAGDKMSVAADGLRRGFARPEPDADYGVAPGPDYATAVRSHFRHALRFPESASFRFGHPRRGYMNEGLLQGGGVAWHGYLIDVEVTRRSSLFGDAVRTQPYVVRMRDGQVIDVHAGAEHEFLGRTD